MALIDEGVLSSYAIVSGEASGSFDRFGERWTHQQRRGYRHTPSHFSRVQSLRILIGETGHAEGMPFDLGSGPSRLHLAAAGESVPPRPTTTRPKRPLIPSATSAVTMRPPRRGGRPRRRGRELRLAEQRGSLPVSLPEPVRSYPHNGRDASITGGFVYHGSQFPVRTGAYFYADYTQNWIRGPRLAANGTLTETLQLRALRRHHRRARRGTSSAPRPRARTLSSTTSISGYSDVGGTFGLEQAAADQVRPLEPGAGRQRIGQSDLPATPSTSRSRVRPARSRGHS